MAVRPSESRRPETRRPKNGFVLIVTSIALTILLALAVLGVDIGRMYVIRAELQSFTDAAALSAAMELDGTDAGLANARTGAARLATGPHAMQWDLGTQPIMNIVSSFSEDGKTWRDQPKQAGDSPLCARGCQRACAGCNLLRIFQALSLNHRCRLERRYQDRRQPEAYPMTRRSSQTGSALMDSPDR